MTFGRVLHAILGLGLAAIQPAWAQQTVVPSNAAQPGPAAYEDQLIDLAPHVKVEVARFTLD